MQSSPVPRRVVHKARSPPSFITGGAINRQSVGEIMNDKKEWSAADIDLLRGLWDEGFSASEIGRRMGLSKNSIVGKSHRLNLPSRPSPIHRTGEYRPPRPPRVIPALPKLESQLVAPLPIVGVDPTVVVLRERPLNAPKPVIVAPEPPPPTIYKPLPSYGCTWPIGEPCTREFRYCDEPSEPGRSYCTDHARVAYQPIKRRAPSEPPIKEFKFSW